MAILQALIAALSRSAGTILNTIFGWAVIALFGRTTQREQTLLSALVGAAVAWPILVLGIFLPRIATFAVSFVPLSKDAPTGIIRIVWLALAALVPLLVGLVVAQRAPPDRLPEPFVK